MTVNKPNPLWCNTCENQRMDPAVKKRYCKKKGGYIDKEWCATWHVGCASHSNIKSIELKNQNLKPHEGVQHLWR